MLRGAVHPKRRPKLRRLCRTVLVPQAFNILRASAPLILNLLMLMVDANVQVRTAHAGSLHGEALRLRGYRTGSGRGVLLGIMR